MSHASMPEGRTVVIAEDDRSLLEVWASYLAGQGLRVETAADGNEAIRKIRALQPDVAVLDLMMPGYGGLELIRELRLKETAAIPLIVVTGRYNTAADRDAILKQPNVVDYYLKPIKLETLKEAVRMALLDAA